MTAAGWLLMIVSVGTVISLVSYCLYTVLSLPPVEVEHLHGQPDIDTRDREDAD